MHLSHPIVRELQIKGELASYAHKGEAPTDVKKRQFTTNLSKNFHLECHTRSCFKNGCCECRGKIPALPLAETNVYFSDKEISWDTWYGAKSARKQILREEHPKYLSILTIELHPTSLRAIPMSKFVSTRLLQCTRLAIASRALKAKTSSHCLRQQDVF